jgi:hypothetical protein
MNDIDDPTIKVLFRVVGQDGVVNIPPVVELAAVRDYLVENALTWEHADPSYSEIYPDEA